jgi:glycosyltransferase involved in cell wall biosynthesis
VLPFDDGVSMINSTLAPTAHGWPIISTHGKSLERFPLHGGNVFLCPPRDPEALAGSIQTVLNRAELKARLRSGPLELSGEWFSWNGVVDRTLAALTSCR